MSVRVEQLTKRFGAFTAVDDVSFTAESGELVALLGPSGGGKSTILRIIAGLEQPDSGTVGLTGDDASYMDAQSRKVGFVFQHYALFRHSTVAGNIGFGLEVQKVPRRERETRVSELLDLVGLQGMGDRMPSQLSGGQRQRVALARALAPRPRVLLLDEPFAAVDAKVRQELREWLRRLHDELHVTSILVTHDQEEALVLADRVIVINHGKLEQNGAPLEIIDEPSSEFVARFVGQANVLDGRVRNGIPQVGPLSIEMAAPGPEGSAVRVVIPAYELKFWHVEEGGVGTVSRVIPLGDRVKVEAQLDGGIPIWAQFPRRSSLLQGVEAGVRIGIEVTRARAYAMANVY